MLINHDPLRRKNGAKVSGMLAACFTKTSIIGMRKEHYRRYFISFRKNPFLNETTLFWRSIPDIDLMNKAAAMFLSHTDYTSFSKTGGQHTTNLCTIFSAQWIMIDEHLLEYRVSANRFLRGMVRAMVGTIMMVGHKKITLSEFEQILLHGNRSDAGESVPPQGLFLSEVQYPYIPQKKLTTNLIPFIL